MDLVGREQEVQALLRNVFSAENRINFVTNGRGDGLGNYIFSLPPVLRTVQSFLAQQSSPVIVLQGDVGVGKSALLQAVAKHCEKYPGLMVFSHKGSAVSLLRRVYDGIDEATDEELMLMPIISRAGRQGGVLLLLDNVEISSWLPVPLPPGVRCIIAGSRCSSLWPSGSYAELRVPVLPDRAAAEMQRRLGLSARTFDSFNFIGQAQSDYNPLWLVLAALIDKCMDNLPDDIHELTTLVVEAAEASIGRPAVEASLCSLTLSQSGLQPNQVLAIIADNASDYTGTWSCIASQFGPLLLLDESGRVQIADLLAEVVRQRYLTQYLACSAAEGRWHQCLSDLFMNGPRDLRYEAAYHLNILGHKQQLLGLLTDWSVFSALLRLQRTQLLEFCKTVGGYTVVGDHLRQRAEMKGRDSLMRRHSFGSLLSQVGEFKASKDWLLGARAEAKSLSMSHELALICTAIAENEVRYWDSLRNWSSVAALSDLLENSNSAVEILRPSGHRLTDPVISRLEYAQALTRWANGCFKAACVAPEASEKADFLQKADEAVQTVRSLFVGSPPSKVVGRALLVGGVAKLVRGHHHRREDASALWRKAIVESVTLLLQAESMLVLSAGQVNEGSIYTHGNLAEIFLHDIRDINAGLYHFTKCCQVGVELWGPEHPNVKRKLQEYGFLLVQCGLIASVTVLDLPGRGGSPILHELLNVLSERLPYGEDALVQVRAWAESEAEV